ncbi:MAG: ARMT1-like domain-containing protein [Velocimicrobium sp.]
MKRLVVIDVGEVVRPQKVRVKDQDKNGDYFEMEGTDLLARATTNEVEIHDKVVYETIDLMTNYKKFRNLPDLAREIHRIVKEQTGLGDPYSKIKERDLEAAKSVYPYLKEFIQSKENNLYWALKIAATGNNMDAAVYCDVDVKNCIEKELEKEAVASELNQVSTNNRNSKEKTWQDQQNGEKLSIFQRYLISYHLNQMSLNYQKIF